VLDDDLDNPDGYNLHSGRATVSYQYDDLYRLTREYCSPGSNSYRREYGYEYWYDAVGNRTKMRFYNVYHDPVWNEETEQYDYTPTWETTTYQYSSRNELTKTYEDASDTTTTFSYDLRGNLTKRGGTEYYWDSQDRLTKVYDGSKTVQYKYDLMGRPRCASFCSLIPAEGLVHIHRTRESLLPTCGKAFTKKKETPAV
jgi:YD repeat-containing protein